MKKRILPLLLSLALCASLVTPALALDQTIQYEDPQSSFKSNFTIKNATKKLDSPISVYDDGAPAPFSNCFEGDFNTVITVGGMTSYAVILLEQQSDGTYKDVMGGEEALDRIDSHVTGKSKEEIIDEYINSEAGKEDFNGNIWYKDNGYLTTEDFRAYLLGLSDDHWGGEEGGLQKSPLDSESYFTFTKPGVYLVCATSGYSPFSLPLNDFSAVLFIGASAPAEPTAPAVPTVSSSPCAATLDGKATTLNAYLFQENGGGSNYVMLRDVAQLLSGTKAQFEVSWEKDKGIVLTTGQAYTPVGGELQSKGDGDKPYTANASTVTVDGRAVELAAYTIEGNNYFKLRDLGAALGFGVDWDNASGTVVIKTTAD